MELSNAVTKPSVRTVLRFTDSELLEAMIEYAEKRGYDFFPGEKAVWHPTDHPADDKRTTLVVDGKGDIQPLITRA